MALLEQKEPSFDVPRLGSWSVIHGRLIDMVKT
jgi:hypothetical protein